MGRREESVAYNETVFRKANEDLRDEWRRMGIERAAEALFICECGDPACKQPMMPAEYEPARATPIRFVIAPGHVAGEVERVVHETDRFAIVEKHPGERQIATATDPRQAQPGE